MFVAAHRDRRTDGLRWGFEPICRVLQVSPASVRSALSRPPSQRAISDEALKPKIKEIFEANYRVYGRRKIKAALARQGLIVDQDRIGRLMQNLNIRGAVRGRKVFTTHADPEAVRAPDLVKRRFVAARPDLLWIADFTYVPTWAGMVWQSGSCISPCTYSRTRMFQSWVNSRARSPRSCGYR